MHSYIAISDMARTAPNLFHIDVQRLADNSHWDDEVRLLRFDVVYCVGFVCYKIFGISLRISAIKHVIQLTWLPTQSVGVQLLSSNAW